MLPYCLFLLIIVLNIVVFCSWIYLSEVKSYHNKTKYYQLVILESRVVRHVQEQIDAGNTEDEILYVEDGYVIMTYSYDSTNNEYLVLVRIIYLHYQSNVTIVYDPQLNEITYLKR